MLNSRFRLITHPSPGISQDYVMHITRRCAYRKVQHIDQIVAEKSGDWEPQVGTEQGLILELESIGQPVLCKPGGRVLQEGESGKGIFILRSGAARVSMSSPDGKTRELRELEPGSFIGLSSALSCDHCCYTVEATDATEFTFVPAEAAQQLLRSRPDLCMQVIQLLGQEMSSLCHERTLLNTDTKPVQIAAK